MKKSSHRDHSTGSSPSSQKDRPKSDGKQGWSFNLSSESLFALGSIDGARRVAYRTATGELRFIPL